MGRIRSSHSTEPSTDAAYAIDAAIEGALLGWGKWVGGRKGGATASSNVMWRYASKPPRAAATAALVVVDEAQARMVEAVVCSPSFSPKLGALLKAHYVFNAHPFRTCARLGISHHAYAEWVWRATLYFAERYRETQAIPRAAA